MIIRGTDQKWNILFGNGKNSYFRDDKYIIQNMLTRLKAWKYDCFFDMNNGVDWQNLLGKTQKSFIDSDIQRTILQSDGIIRLIKFESYINTSREYIANIEILTINNTTYNIDMNNNEVINE